MYRALVFQKIQWRKYWNPPHFVEWKNILFFLIRVHLELGIYNFQLDSLSSVDYQYTCKFSQSYVLQINWKGYIFLKLAICDKYISLTNILMAFKPMIGYSNLPSKLGCLSWDQQSITKNPKLKVCFDYHTKECLRLLPKRFVTGFLYRCSLLLSKMLDAHGIFVL